MLDCALQHPTKITRNKKSAPSKQGKNTQHPNFCSHDWESILAIEQCGLGATFRSFRECYHSRAKPHFFVFPLVPYVGRWVKLDRPLSMLPTQLLGVVLGEK